jgi:hypothetical protein
MTHDRSIAAVTVNHNTSRYAELMLRSLFATHPPDLLLSLMLYDNASRDDTSALEAYARSRGIRAQQSGFTTQTPHNSHGEILRRFVLGHPECDYYLFLDADVCFVQQDTIGTMLRELETDSAAFGIGPRLSWDGETELPREVADGNPDIYEARLHPCCALIKNTAVFRDVVQEVGLSCVKVLWAEQEEYLDTLKLMTRVMRTHGQHHLISSAMVIHFFCVSYDWDPEQFMRQKACHRDRLLASYRQVTSDNPGRR